MKSGDRDLDTICAISTPSGSGGIAVLRISGKSALLIGRKVCPFLPAKLESHRVYFGLLKDPSDQSSVDEVLVTYFQSGKSYTGEEVLEISCHGSPSIAQAILTLLVEGGCRVADRGEFTYRAFINGKMDLVQAESVLSLIQSQGKRSAEQALRQLRGDLSKRIEKMESQLIWVLARLEVGIDFSTEDIQVVDLQDLENRIVSIRDELLALTNSYRTGRLVRDGVQLALVGEPNVGKSSLLNVLAEEDRAIVSDEPGTTRDLVEASFQVDGYKVVATDTAGLRETSVKVEKIGIERSHRTISQADLTFFIFDLVKGLGPNELAILEGLDTEKLYLIGNKKDQFRGFLDEARRHLGENLRTLKNFQKTHEIETFLKSRVYFVSALDKTCSEELRAAIGSILPQLKMDDQALISQARHYENLQKALANMERAIQLVQAKGGAEFIALEVKEGLMFIQETLGKRFDDEIMDRVFKDFCIGK